MRLNFENSLWDEMHKAVQQSTQAYRLYKAKNERARDQAVRPESVGSI